jgi:hypothetical protein
MYEGDFKNNKMNGVGEFIGFDGYHYKGNWLNNKQEGKGTEIWGDGGVYVG